MQLLKYNYALPRNRKINTLQARIHGGGGGGDILELKKTDGRREQLSNTDNRCSTLSPVELKPASGTDTDDVNDGDKIHGCSLP
jgi:hypothetical protein